jgi:hypothetical protein
MLPQVLPMLAVAAKPFDSLESTSQKSAMSFPCRPYCRVRHLSWRGL